MHYLLILFVFFVLCTPKKTPYQLDIYFGVPGSGKSTFAAKLAKNAMKESKIIKFARSHPSSLSSWVLASPFFKRSVYVYSNLPIAGARVLNPRDDLGTHLVEHCLIIIDEAGVDYSSRDFKNFPEENRRFFKYHRHEYTQIAIFSQDPDDMDKVIRELAHNRYIVVKSIFPKWFIAKRVRKKIIVDDISKKLISADIKPSPFTDWTWCYGPSVWYLFNSHSRLGLPNRVDWSVYSSDPKKSKLKNILVSAWNNGILCLDFFSNILYTKVIKKK